MTAKGVYGSVAGLALLLAFSVGVAFWFPREVGQDLHGPVGLLVALPFFGLFCLGALILTIAVVRSARLATLPTLIGLAPAAVALVVMVLLTLTAAV